MRDVRIKKDELLAKLLENKAKHRKVFEEALDGYRHTIIGLLERELEQARAGKRIRGYFHVEQPMDQTPEYEKVIAMLEMEQNDVVTLTAQEFESYVMDRWHWKKQFLTSNMKYSSTAAVMALQEGIHGEDDDTPVTYTAGSNLV